MPTSSPRRVRIAASCFLVFSGLASVFQLAMAAGAPWGHLTMGGAYPGVLPLEMRIAAVVQAGILAAFGAVVAARAGLALRSWSRASHKLIWVVVAYGVVGAILNAATPSPMERLIWLPVTLVLGVSSLIVTRSARLTDLDVPREPSR